MTASDRSSLAELDAEYSPSRIVPEFQAIVAEYRRRSDAAKQTLRCELNMRYGDGEGELLHHFPPRHPRSPLLVYVHGGHWQDLSIDDSCFAASGLIRQGAGFVAVGYGLAPARTLDAIVRSVGKAVEWVLANASSLGTARSTIYAAGSSAGAHLLAMALGSAPSASSEGLAGVALLSGVYELSLLQRSYVNVALGLTETDARRNSPIHHLPIRAAEVIVARGETETAEYARQHELLVTAVRGSAGARPGETVLRSMVCCGRNHFDLPLGLGDPEDEVGHAVLQQMRLGS